MPAAAINREVRQFLKDQTKKTFFTGQEVARAVLLMRKWALESLTLQGANNAITKKNISNWIFDFENTFRDSAIRVNMAGGYSGYALTNAIDKNTVSKELYLEAYTQRVKQLTNRDFTWANIQAQGLKARWAEDYVEFFEQYDAFLKEGNALGLTQKEITDQFVRSPIFHQNVSLIDSGGRFWKPETYAEMYSRTRAGEMETSITVDEMDELDFNFVQISSHNTKTPICKQFEGKFYAQDPVTAQQTGLPLLEVTPPFHPNCLHILLPRKGLTPTRMRRTNLRRDSVADRFNLGLTSSQKKTIVKQEAYIIKNRPLNQ